MKKAKRQTLLAADLFCGAGGTSSGLLAACKANNIELQLIAINHWQIAIDIHSANHPYAKHLCESMDNVDPRKLVPKGRLNVLIAGPECTHHSNARGGRPMSDQSRASAWHILRWAEALYIENILIENVKEFRTWGPLGANGRPIKRLRGQLYLNFLAAFRARGFQRYSIDGLFHLVRWHYNIETERRPENEFELNNNFTSRYARAIMEKEPDLAGFLKLGRSRVHKHW